VDEWLVCHKSLGLLWRHASQFVSFVEVAAVAMRVNNLSII